MKRFVRNMPPEPTWFYEAEGLALKGYVLSRNHGDDGPVRFYVTRWGMVRELAGIEAVRAFAAQVGVQT